MHYLKKLACLFSFLLLSVSAFGQTYPNCASSASDPDGDGWGWENNQSCKVVSSSSGTPNCASSASDPDGDGWGWENNKSCKVVSSGGSSGSIPNCSSSSSDPDGDGWGWENNQSCKVVSSGGSSGSSSGSCPTSLSCPNGMSCGCYVLSGLGANKRAYQSAGAGRNFLASAMMETEKMDTNYAYGDNKSGDSFNAGATKQNWGMMRQCHPAWRGYGSGDYAVSAAMNSSRSLDVQIYNECRNYYGDSWFAGHRNGSAGLSNPNTQDINNFRAGYNWTYNQLSGHESDDVRFWFYIPAI